MAKSLRKAKAKRNSPKAGNAKAPITQQDIVLLRDAIEDTKSLKGGLMPEDWPEHEDYTKHMELALKRVRYQCRLLTTLRNITNAGISDEGIVKRFRHVMENYK